MVTTERAARLLDQMSSLAAAAALSLPTPTGAVRMLGQADDLTAAGVLLEMSAPSAAGLVRAMDAERAVRLLGQAAPVTVAGILGTCRATGAACCLTNCPEPFRLTCRQYSGCACSAPHFVTVKYSHGPCASRLAVSLPRR